MMFRYYACGLHLASEIPLHGFLSREARVPADVEIRLGPVPEILPEVTHPGPFLQVAGMMTARFGIRGVVSCLIENGNRITVAPEPDATEQDVALFMSGTVMGILCHQRGLFPLHAAAVEIRGQAVVFAGDSGAGKSTLAAVLCRQGYRLLADDISVMDIHAPEGVLVMPALPRQALWRDSMAALRLAPGRHLRSGQEPDVFEYPVGSAFQSEPRPLAAVCYLTQSRLPGKSEIQPLTGTRGIQALRAQVYRLHGAQQMGLESRIFMNAGYISTHVRQYAIQRPQKFPELSGFLGAFLEMMDQTGALQ